MSEASTTTMEDNNTGTDKCAARKRKRAAVQELRVCIPRETVRQAVREILARVRVKMATEFSGAVSETSSEHDGDCERDDDNNNDDDDDNDSSDGDEKETTTAAVADNEKKGSSSQRIDSEGMHALHAAAEAYISDIFQTAKGLADLSSRHTVTLPVFKHAVRFHERLRAVSASSIQ